MTEPRTVGRYVLGARIGAGGMAEVVRARAPGLGLASQDVALKLMHRHLADDPEFVRLFFREAQVASSLRHPNVVGVLESGEDDGTYYLAMELVEGPTLRQLIRGHGGAPFDIAAAVTIVCGLCEGLHHAHERKAPDGTPLCIVHRDVSPGNVLLSTDGAVKLSDFGVATATAAWTSLRSTTGSIRGKVAYMAPEQARAQQVDRRADVFSLGNILFELLEGRRLLQARGEVELLHELIFAGFGDGRPTRADCPPALADAIARALAADPDARFPTALAFADALRAAVTPMDAAPLGRYVARFADVEPPTTPVRDPEPAVPTATVSLDVPAPTATLDVAELAAPPPRRPWLALAGASALLLAAAAVVFAPNGDPPRSATTGLSFATPSATEPPPEAQTPEAEPPEVEAAPVPVEPSSRKSKRTRRKKPRPKPSTLAKPPPNESLFPH